MYNFNGVGYFFFFNPPTLKNNNDNNKSFFQTTMEKMYKWTYHFSSLFFPSLDRKLFKSNLTRSHASSFVFFFTVTFFFFQWNSLRIIIKNKKMIHFRRGYILHFGRNKECIRLTIVWFILNCSWTTF